MINNYNQNRFMFLIGKIPNWEIHLTDKQLECCKLYICNLDTYMVDDKLNLKRGTCFRRIFGNSKNKGALGRLEEIYIRLDNIGYFKEKEVKKKNSVNNKAILSNRTLEKVKELFKMITEIQDYNKYLTKSQNEKIYYFLKTRSFKECAKYFNVTEVTFKQSILGRDDNSGVYGKLKKIHNEIYINDWDSI